MTDDLVADETGGQLLDQEMLSGVEWLDVEVIREHYDDHGHEESYNVVRRRGRIVTETRWVQNPWEQVETFQERVSSFLDDHEVYSVDISVLEEDEGYIHEAWIVYGEV
ncbi:MAG: hypothetical protein SVU32_09545 [Candidatus Nanohaloarchaea archaeon]|nr:hypothetical protein [Candidatus Nanohaloarchaea archaeon]